MISDAAWRKLPEWMLIAGVVACVGVVTWIVIDLWPHPTPIPAPEQRSLDSLASTRPDFRARVDTLIQHETTFVAISRQNRAESIVTARRADSLRRVAIVADSAARAQRDTSSLWRRAAEVWHATADTLAAANVRLGSAYAAESAARVNADVRADEATRRLSATESLNARLSRDLQHAEPPCRALWLRCPSRRAVAVGSAALTLVAVAAAHSLSR
jgi:hypothetical protein